MNRPLMVLKSVCAGVVLGLLIICLVFFLVSIIPKHSPEEDMEELIKRSTPSPSSSGPVDDSVDWGAVIKRLPKKELLKKITHGTQNAGVPGPKPPPYDPNKPANYSLITITPEMITPCGEDLMCQKYLLPATDVKLYQQCMDKLHAGNYSQAQRPLCRLMNGAHRGAVALVSLPGSGNTWVRGLLEQATGICTGAVYCDPTLQVAGMVGEGLRSGTVLVVKTHRNLHPSWTLDTKTTHMDEKMVNPMWTAAVLIIRNPMDAMIAEWNRLQSRNLSNVVGDPATTGSHHVNIVGPEFFGKNPDWVRFLRSATTRWKSYFEHWALSGFPVLVVRYEDIKANTVATVMRILNFLKFPSTEEEVRSRLARDFSLFQRKTHPTIEHFSIAQRNYIRRCLEETLDLLKEKNHGDTLGVEGYLNSTTMHGY